MFTHLFWMLASLTLAIWILRGLGVLAFLPGAVLWLLLLLTFAASVLSQVSR